MRIMGVVAEYNPFHNGHVYQIEHAKNDLIADGVIVAMSGDFVQRGEPAIIDKYTRAKLATENGADLVIEMPTVASTASAEIFAETGVSLLLATGVVTDLMFGCEDEDPEMFAKVARYFLDEPHGFKESLNKQLRMGIPFAKARANAIVENWDNPDEREKLSKFLEAPNNILGIAYTRALLAHNDNIGLHPIHRHGVSHDDSTFSANFASASLIRRMLFQDTTQDSVRSLLADRDTRHAINGDSIAMFIPENEVPVINTLVAKNMLVGPDDFSLLVHQALLYHNSLSEYLDCNEDISNRILNERNEFISFTQFADHLKTKNLNHSRIRRILCHLVLRLHHNELSLLKAENFAPYIRVLAFSDSGRALLTEIRDRATVPIIVSPQEMKKDPRSTREKEILMNKDIYAADLYRAILTDRLHQAYPTEYTRKFSN
ncbi:MAG: nucleotidyltransferase family protein [Lachnospiraceae bacterium]|nr:nucleotidyltransferase family protein [Lachnospiraceae bacterium]